MRIFFFFRVTSRSRWESQGGLISAPRVTVLMVGGWTCARAMVRQLHVVGMYVYQVQQKNCHLFLKLQDEESSDPVSDEIMGIGVVLMLLRAPKMSPTCGDGILDSSVGLSYCEIRQRKSCRSWCCQEKVSHMCGLKGGDASWIFHVWQCINVKVLFSL